jgi:hypothetical protein
MGVNTTLTKPKKFQVIAVLNFKTWWHTTLRAEVGASGDQIQPGLHSGPYLENKINF